MMTMRNWTPVAKQRAKKIHWDKFQKPIFAGQLDETTF